MNTKFKTYKEKINGICDEIYSKLLNELEENGSINTTPKKNTSPIYIDVNHYSLQENETISESLTILEISLNSFDEIYITAENGFGDQEEIWLSKLNTDIDFVTVIYKIAECIDDYLK